MAPCTGSRTALVSAVLVVMLASLASPAGLPAQDTDRAPGEVWWETVEGEWGKAVWSTAETARKFPKSTREQIEALVERYDAEILQRMETVEVRQRPYYGGLAFGARAIVRLQLRKKEPAVTSAHLAAIVMTRPWVDPVMTGFETLLTRWRAMEARLGASAFQGLAPAGHGARLEEILDRLKRLSGLLDQLHEEPTQQTLEAMEQLRAEIEEEVAQAGGPRNPRQMATFFRDEASRLDRIAERARQLAADDSTARPDSTIGAEEAASTPADSAASDPPTRDRSAANSESSQKPDWLTTRADAPQSEGSSSRAADTDGKPAWLSTLTQPREGSSPGSSPSNPERGGPASGIRSAALDLVSSVTTERATARAIEDTIGRIQAEFRTMKIEEDWWYRKPLPGITLTALRSCGGLTGEALRECQRYNERANDPEVQRRWKEQRERRREEEYQRALRRMNCDPDGRCQQIVTYEVQRADTCSIRLTRSVRRSGSDAQVDRPMTIDFRELQRVAESSPGELTLTVASGTEWMVTIDPKRTTSVVRLLSSASRLCDDRGSQNPVKP